MGNLIADLRRHVAQASQAPEDLLASARDLWPRDTLALLGRHLHPRPLAVCWPQDHGEVEALLAWATAQGVPLVPYGGGSGVCGGATAGPRSVVVDLKRMNRISPVGEEQDGVTVEPGVVGQVLEDHLARHGKTTGHSPSSIWCSTVGGWAAARSAGQFSSLYGKFEDMVLGMRVATPGGNVETGIFAPPGEEDLGPVIMGSEGTMGVITSLTVRTAPLPAHRWLAGYAFPNLHEAWEAMRGIMQGGPPPAVLRLYDPVDTRVGGRLGGSSGSSRKRGPSAIARLRSALDSVEAVRRHQLAPFVALPRLLNRLAGSLGGGVLLIVGYEGEQDHVTEAARQARRILSTGDDLGPEPGLKWFAHRHDVSYKMSPVFCRGAFADTMEVASTWSRLPELYHGAREALSRHVLTMAHFSHAYPEGCSIYFSFAGRADQALYDRAWEDGLDAAARAGGTVTHHHGVGQLKAEAATRELGHALRVYLDRKARLDPAGVLNPGRLFHPAPVEGTGPPPPVGPGPVFSLNTRDLLAEVDPWADPAALRHALADMGHRLKFQPDAPLATWLQAWRPPRDLRLEVPFLGIQARFADGCAARIGVAPRSAAGPDLRLALLREARAELLQVPVLPSSQPSGGRHG